MWCSVSQCVTVRMHVCGCVPARGRACECMRLSLLSRICGQESNKCHDLSHTLLGVCSCLFWSGTSRLHAMMFQTSTYMGICIIICICVCSGAYLHGCMYMPCTHNTHIHAHIHAHTTHTPHHNEFSTRLFFHQYLSQSWAETSEFLG